MQELTAVWGTCDGVDILFEQTGGDTWEACVPADLQDGQYVVEIWGRTSTGYLLYTTAVLYLCDSKCVSLRFCEDISVKVWTQEHYVRISEDRIQVEQTGHLITVSERFRERVVVKCA